MKILQWIDNSAKNQTLEKFDKRVKANTEILTYKEMEQKAAEAKAETERTARQIEFATSMNNTTLRGPLTHLKKTDKAESGKSISFNLRNVSSIEGETHGGTEY